MHLHHTAWNRSTAIVNVKEHISYHAIIRVIIKYRWLLLLLFCCVLLPLYLFGELAEKVWSAHALPWDNAILWWTRQYATAANDSLMLGISRLGYLYGVVPVDIGLFALLLLLRRWHDAIFFGLAVSGAAALNLFAKALFGRVRPALWEVVAPEMTYSFPSGHAMGSMALAAALVVLVWNTNWRWLAVFCGGLFTLLVGVSRVYLGVHYPSDVLAGWAASLAWVVGLNLMLYSHRAKPRATTDSVLEETADDVLESI